MDEFFNFIKDLGTAWPVIAFIAVILLGITRFIWRRVGEKRRTIRRGRKEVTRQVQRTLDQLRHVNTIRAELRSTQLEFASTYTKVTDNEKDELVRRWHRVQMIYSSEVQKLAQAATLPMPELDNQPELRRAWEAELIHLNKLAADASNHGSVGPFSNSSGPTWDNAIVNVEAYAGRFGLHLEPTKEPGSISPSTKQINP